MRKRLLELAVLEIAAATVSHELLKCCPAVFTSYIAPGGCAVKKSPLVIGADLVNY